MQKFQPLLGKMIVGVGLAFGVCTLSSAQSAAASYPSKPIRLVIPYSPGGLSDGIARTIADELQRTHNMQIIVENKTGGNTVPAAMAVTRANPDGYTVGWFSASTFTTVPKLMPDLPFKVADFKPVLMAYSGPIVMAVSTKVPVKNAAEYVAWVKQEGKPALVGATAKGGAGHLTTVALGQSADMKVDLVAYRGGPPMVTELVGGQLNAAMDILDTFLTQHKAGNLKVIGHTGAQRLDVIPEVQTFAEAGFPEVKGQFWHGLFAPAGTPDEIVALLNQRIGEALKAPAVQARLSPDLTVGSYTPAQFADHIARDREYWEQLIDSASITLQ